LLKESNKKTTARYHITPVRTANFKKAKSIGEDVKERKP
jgi:hypothetical protein